jgi:hypothetical protein
MRFSCLPKGRMYGKPVSETIGETLLSFWRLIKREEACPSCLT